MDALISWFRGYSSVEVSKIPDEVEELNDSLYELYTPAGTPELNVIFFHGLQFSDYENAYWKTWSSDSRTCWPKTLLAEGRLPNARILSVSYDSSASTERSKGRGLVDLAIIAENLVYDIILSAKLSSCPVILVGHSLGGLVIKKFLLTAFKSRNMASEGDGDIIVIDKFLSNLCGIFYYGTPHQGSRLGDLARIRPGNSRVLKFLKTLSKDTSRLNDDFKRWRTRRKIPTFSIAEGLPIFGIWRFGLVVVKEASVMFDSDYRYVAQKHHSGICKHTKMTESSFRHLVQFIKDVVREKQPESTITDIERGGPSNQEPGSSSGTPPRVRYDQISTTTAVLELWPSSNKKSGSSSPPEGVRRINDSLYELYAPKLPSSEEPEVDIVFFHDLQTGDYREAYWKDWSSDGVKIWPRTLLGESAFGKARILAVSYDSSCKVRPTSGRFDMHTIGENLLADMILWETESVSLGKRPVILVGYGVGGLVIKRLVLTAFKERNDLYSSQNKLEEEQTQKIENFLSNLRGVFYYDTPQQGSQLAYHLSGTSEIRNVLYPLNIEIARLNNDFHTWHRNSRVPTFGLHASLPTKIGTFWGAREVRAIEEVSCRYDADSFCTAPNDHFSVSKPTSMTDPTFHKLWKFVKECVETASDRLTNSYEG